MNGTVEIGGPEQFRLDELVRTLGRWNDSREVVADPKASYYGAKMSEKTLVPEDDARLGETRFETWLSQSKAKARARIRKPHEKKLVHQPRERWRLRSNERIIDDNHKTDFAAGMSVVGNAVGAGS